ncbi:hypothetical protein IV203_012653 [Nitzschia inconspicua]|uniref:Uncharacterized protein n=1 Tax=Nitzschia inconspicua TaxID=303405 RepID=A0A9K3K9I2_9STRA|nr:hypothetical protein IV203_012773 [Nitzschia inconspicua]KAG7350056.1 hypothetical protein IV203_012653 [Nitzschia inconspicua]
MKQKYSTAVANRKKKATDRKSHPLTMDSKEETNQRNKKISKEERYKQQQQQHVYHQSSRTSDQPTMRRKDKTIQSASSLNSRHYEHDHEDDTVDEQQQERRRRQRRKEQQQQTATRSRRPSSNQSVRSLESFDSSRVSFASPISTSQRILTSSQPQQQNQSNRPKNSSRNGQSEHLRGRSPSRRPRDVSGVDDHPVSQEDRDDEDGSFAQDVNDEEDRSYISYSSDSSGTFEDSADDDDDDDYYDDGESSWNSSASERSTDYADDDGDEVDDVQSRRSFVSYEEDDHHPPTEDEEDREYAENKLRDIGTVVRAADLRQDDNDDVHTDMSYDTKDEKSLDTAEEQEFQDFMKRERKKKGHKNANGVFFWMLGFGISQEEEGETSSSTAKEDPNNGQIEEDTETVGETVLSEAPYDDDDYDDYEDGSTLAEESVMTPTSIRRRQPRNLASQQSQSSLHKTKSIETTRVAKEGGCFINFMSSADSMDESYGGLRDGDILIAESSHSILSSKRGSRLQEVDDDDDDDDDYDDATYSDAEDTRTEVTSQADYTVGYSVATETPQEQPQEENDPKLPATFHHPFSIYDRPLSPPSPMTFFTWFSQDEMPAERNDFNAQQQTVARQELYGAEEANSGLGSVSIEETIVVHTIVDSSRDDEEREEEDKLKQAVASNHDDESSRGDTTINTSPPKQYAEQASKLQQGTGSESSAFIPAKSNSASGGSNTLLSYHATDLTTGIPPSLGSFAAALAPIIPIDESTDARSTEDGMKLVVSFHRRGIIVPDSDSETEEKHTEQEVGTTSGSEISYKEEFELELGSYELEEHESQSETSSSSSDSGTNDGPRKKKAEMLEHYDISEIVHGRRKFMPKPKADTADTAFSNNSRLEKSGIPSGSHQPSDVNAAVAASRRRQLRLTALKAHRDFLHAKKIQAARLENNIDPISKTIEEVVASDIPPSDDSQSAELSLEGSNALQKVQPSGEWIEKTWQSLGTEELAPNSSLSAKNQSGPSFGSNSIAEDNQMMEANVQKADVLVDLVRTALNGILSQDDNDKEAPNSHDKSSEDQTNLVPDVFQAAYDFFGLNKQEAAVLTDTETSKNDNVLKCTGFNPNPILPVSTTDEKKDVCESIPPKEDELEESGLQSEQQEASSESEQIVGSHTQSSQDITSHSDEAVLEVSSSKEGTEDRKNDVDRVERFNVDGIPLELRPKKIWKAFDSFKTVPNTEDNTKHMVDSSVEESRDTPASSPKSASKIEVETNLDPVSGSITEPVKPPPETIRQQNSDSGNSTNSGSSSSSSFDSQMKDKTLQRQGYQKHAETLQFKSRRLHHISRIANRRLTASAKPKHTTTWNGEAKDSVKSTTAKPPSCPKEQVKSYMPYSSEATTYRQQVNDIRSRLRQRRRTKIFRAGDDNVGGAGGARAAATMTSNNNETTQQRKVEHRDDSSSGGDEFFDANSSVVADDNKQQQAVVTTTTVVSSEAKLGVDRPREKEESESSEAEKTSIAEDLVAATAVQYHFSEESQMILDSTQQVNKKSTSVHGNCSQDELNLSIRSRGSLCSAFSLD